MASIQGIKFFIRTGVFSSQSSQILENAELIEQYSSFSIKYSFAERLIFTIADYIIINPVNGMVYQGTYETVVDIIGFRVKTESYAEDKNLIMEVLKFKLFDQFKAIAEQNGIVFPDEFGYSHLATFPHEEVESFTLNPLVFKPFPRRYTDYLELL